MQCRCATVVTHINNALACADSGVSGIELCSPDLPKAGIGQLALQRPQSMLSI